MSILQYFTVINKSRIDDQLCSSSAIQLPDPCGPLSDKVPTTAITSGNAAVSKAIKKSETSQKQKRPYLYLTDAQRYEVGKKAAASGTANTLQYYANQFPELWLTEPTVRRLKNDYNDFVKDLPQDKRRDLKELPRKKKQGRPLLLGNELDKQVQSYIKYLRERGTAVNTAVIMASAEGIVKSKDAQFIKREWWIWRH